MPFTSTLLAILGALFVWYLIQQLQKKRRREQLRRMPTPEHWHSILKTNVPFLRFLPQNLRIELFQRMNIFLAEKTFTGSQGLEITEEMRVTVAAQACLILLNKSIETYPGLHTIVMYPSSFRSQQQKTIEHGITYEHSQARIGESWTRGHVILSWKHSRRGGRNFRDGHNVVIHEFAHQLDQADGRADGIPDALPKVEQWIRVFQKNYRAIAEQYKKPGKKPLLRKYGLTNAAEFFSVSSELFFEKPRSFRRNYPDLYDELKRFYKLDPYRWHIKR